MRVGRLEDARQAITSALEIESALKAGGCEAVESLAALALAVEDGADRSRLVARAEDAAGGLKAGTWDAVRALALLARAQRLRDGDPAPS